jgi:phage replication O-like protein O
MSKNLKYTQFPNIILDRVAELSGSDAKVMMFFVRQTFGWHRDQKIISLQSISTGIKMSKRVVIKTVKNLVEKCFVEQQKGVGLRGMHGYRLVVDDQLLKVTSEGDDDWLPKVTSDRLPKVTSPELPIKDGNKDNKESAQPAVPAISISGNQKPPDKEPKTTKEKTTNPGVRVFIDGWCLAYQETYGEKYIVAGERDGPSVKRLLASNGASPEDYLALAKRAWDSPSDSDHFWCNHHARTIAMFCSRIMEIKGELRCGAVVAVRPVPPSVLQKQLEDVRNDIEVLEVATRYARPPEEAAKLADLRGVESRIKSKLRAAI